MHSKLLSGNMKRREGHLRNLGLCSIKLDFEQLLYEDVTRVPLTCDTVLPKVL